MKRLAKVFKSALSAKITSDLCHLCGLVVFVFSILAVMYFCVANFNCMKYAENVMADDLPYPPAWSETLYNAPYISYSETIYGDNNIPLPPLWSETIYATPISETIYGDIVIPDFTLWNETTYNPIIEENESTYN